MLSTALSKTLLCLLDVVYCNQRPLIFISLSISQAAVIHALLNDAYGDFKKKSTLPENPSFLFRGVDWSEIDQCIGYSVSRCFSNGLIRYSLVESLQYVPISSLYVILVKACAFDAVLLSVTSRLTNSQVLLSIKGLSTNQAASSSVSSSFCE